MADMLCKPGPLAVRAAKKAMYDGLSASLEKGLEIEKEMTDLVVSTEDFDEGTKAFVEKRKPDWKAR
jgi:enoyl-CoA hydratase/carnithine racemase